MGVAVWIKFSYAAVCMKRDWLAFVLSLVSGIFLLGVSFLVDAWAFVHLEVAFDKVTDIELGF